MTPQAALLPDGQRMHLHHGPIDLIIGAEGGDRDRAYKQANERFQTLLVELVDELPGLRQHRFDQGFKGHVARQMAKAVAPYETSFVTPMAAVAGAVADEVLGALIHSCRLSKAYVNNGGDIAFYLTEGGSVKAESAAGPIEIRFEDPVRGMATSGWRGRSFSLGIADAVTVVSRTASMADAAATMIANAVDLPGHPNVSRIAASDVETGHELGDKMVTTGVGPLELADIDEALDRGEAFAVDCLNRGLIAGAVLSLAGEVRVLTEADMQKPGR